MKVYVGIFIFAALAPVIVTASILFGQTPNQAFAHALQPYFVLFGLPLLISSPVERKRLYRLYVKDLLNKDELAEEGKASDPTSQNFPERNDFR